MKHTLKVTLFFLILFLISNIVGLSLLTLSTDQVNDVNGTIKINYTSTTLGDRADVQGLDSIIYIAVGIAIGTIILLIMARKNTKNLWRFWFFIASAMAISVAVGVLLKPELAFVAWIIGLGLSAWKVYYPNFYIQNLSEILMYAGIAILFVPILDITTMAILLFLISFYDMYAVWKSKHMVKMARFTTDANVFPGLIIPYKKENGKTKIISKKFKSHKEHEEKKTGKKAQGKTGILGGGDVVFPMLFAGTVMMDLITKGYTTQVAFGYSLSIVIFSAIALFSLFYYSKKDKFYPAMPFVSVGCFIGYGVMLLLLLI